MTESSYDNPWVLMVGLVLAITAHLAATQPVAYWLNDVSPEAQKKEDDSQEDQSPRPGKSNDSPRVTVAWIGYDDYKQLIAPKSVAEQPALQNEVDPMEGAPLEMNPTPPAPTSPAERPATLVAVPMPIPTTGESEAATIEVSTSKPRTASLSTPIARPTSIPRDEGESVPVIRTVERIAVQPGSVLVGDGIEIKTARAWVAAVARASTLPKNPEAEITFDHTGTAIAAKLTTSTGSDNFDAPILASLYKWKAKGPKIDELEGHLVFTVTILLGSE